MKTLQELKNLNTKNLLRYYKAERRRFYGSGYTCGCGCCEFIWDVNTRKADMEQKYLEHKKYLDLIKSELNTREHIENL